MGLLVLSRKKNQRIFIDTPCGERIVITTIQISDGKVRLGFEADRGVAIDREETLEAKKEHR